MKKNAWQSSLCALALLVFAVLGCNKLSGDAPKTGATPNNNSSSTNQPTTTTTPDIAGNYDAVGTNPNGSLYKGTLEVIERGEVYQFRWNAGRQYDGIGVPNGNVVSVSFTGGSDGKGCGVVNYELSSDGTLDGKWGYWGVNQIGTEKAVRTSGAGLAGNYDATGKNFDGGAYKGTLAVTSAGSGYKFDWSNGSSGYGIQRGNNVSVGFGGTRCAFVAYEIKSDGTLDGIWGGYGSSKTGTEKATKK